MCVEEIGSEAITNAFLQGDLLVYPTEAVMGIGCDPDNEQAVQRLLTIKQRPQHKGVILVADTYSQLLPYIEDRLIKPDMRTEIVSSWPGPVTWLLPKSKSAPAWISGEHDSIAVRVSAHPVVKQLCQQLNKPIVSTSANLSGQEPARTQAQAFEYFADAVTYVAGSVGENARPSTIRDGGSGAIIRE